MPQCIIGNVKIHAEIPILLLFFAFMFENSVTTNLIMYKTCYITLGYNRSECALLGSNYSDNATTKLEEKVQPHATIILMIRSVVDAIIPPILCFFLGSWSDKYGRKPVLLASFGGFVIAYIMMAIISVLPNVSPWYYLLVLIPSCMTGGFPALFTTSLSYISDVTSEEARGVRMGIFEAMLTVGILLGSSTSSFAFNAYGYLVVYLVCIICVVVAWIFILVFMPESISNVESERKVRNLFKFSLVKETVQTTFRRRANNDRALLLTIISLMSIFLLASLADSGVIFLYLREKFHWSLERFTLLVAINNITWIIGTIIGAYILHKLLNITETVVILLGLVTNMFGYVLQGFATKNWQIYAAGTSECLGGAVCPMARSLLSKLVPIEETGKIFAVVTALETIVGVFGSPIYTFVYNSTLLTFPGAFNLVTAGILFFAIILTIITFFLQRNEEHISYTDLINEGLIN